MSKTPRKAVDRASPSTAASSEEGTITYQPTLISDLTYQHTRILNDLKVIEAYARSGSHAKLRAALAGFRKQLHAHLLQENLFLYSYLAQFLRETFDDNRRQAATEMFNEMSVIARTVIEFLNYYSEHPVAAGDLAEFCSELDGIFNSLQERMFREEMTLFKLYVPRAG